jgi:hypothetical protein
MNINITWICIAENQLFRFIFVFTKLYIIYNWWVYSSWNVKGHLLPLIIIIVIIIIMGIISCIRIAGLVYYPIKHKMWRIPVITKKNS